MYMEHGLPRISVAVGHGAITRSRDAFLAGDLLGCERELAQKFRILGLGFIETRDVLTRHDQHVGRGLGRDVPECDEVAIFID